MTLLLDTETWYSVGAQLRECSKKLEECTHTAATARDEVGRCLQQLEEHSTGMTGVLHPCADTVRESTDAMLPVTISSVADQIVGTADNFTRLDEEFRRRLGP